ncbi:phage tail protein [Bombilactobacillus folatiphilus]|uniref:Phage tail protein n=1 Tax=Bombilactobacillus folatiphilus TaxID=2923362 RepID=A0ABY4PAH1_9LACO|nr:phage tail protein [Bombilactobacillus folatiphilus]UQS82605.1 phage tail protein [Bombilactobacillus folatiphilus]
MVKVKFSISGDKELSRKLTKMQDKEGVRLAIKTNTLELQQKIMEETSTAYVKGYSTQTTKRTTTFDFPNKFIGEAGIVQSYNPYTEYGTRFMQAEPVVKPAFEKQRPIFISDLQKLVK